MSGKNGAIKLVAGNSNPALARGISDYLKLPLTKAVVRRFADMEIFVEIQENVRGADVFVIQSTSFPANDHLMELLIIIDALRRSSARRITAVIPYFGYARQDRKPGPRTPISAKLVANLITRAGADRVMTLDLHAGQIQGFFDIPTDNLYASPVMVRDIRERFQARQYDGRVARRRRRGARAWIGQTHQRPSRNHRQAARARRRIRSDERDRRRRGIYLRARR
jgi:ribose-phosphate pyrophosphokinase